MLIRPLTDFHKKINDLSNPSNISLLNGIESLHEFRRLQKDIEKYYNNYIHNLDYINDDALFKKDFIELRYVRAYFKILLESLNKFEDTLFLMQQNDNRNGVLPTISQLYKLLTVRYKKNIFVEIFSDSREINGIIYKAKQDINLVSCFKEIANGNLTGLKNYINRYNTLLIRPNSYVENERHEKIKNRLITSYYNLRDTNITKEKFNSLYEELSL